MWPVAANLQGSLARLALPLLLLHIRVPPAMTRLCIKYYCLACLVILPTAHLTAHTLSMVVGAGRCSDCALEQRHVVHVGRHHIRATNHVQTLPTTGTILAAGAHSSNLHCPNRHPGLCVTDEQEQAYRGMQALRGWSLIEKASNKPA
jgi:hypothetical protein